MQSTKSKRQESLHLHSKVWSRKYVKGSFLGQLPRVEIDGLNPSPASLNIKYHFVALFYHFILIDR